MELSIRDQYHILIISSASGAGKTTLIRNILRQFPQIQFSVSSTTRSPRKGEIHGRDYYFISNTEFQSLVQGDAFLEYARVHQNWYGTTKAEVQRIIRQDTYCLLDIDVQGFLQVKDKVPHSHSIFILPPSIETLRSRLAARNTETDEEINIRIQNAKNELHYKDRFDYQVENDQLDQALEKLFLILTRIVNNQP
jgi:guanylate kinase